MDFQMRSMSARVERMFTTDSLMAQAVLDDMSSLVGSFERASGSSKGHLHREKRPRRKRRPALRLVKSEQLAEREPRV